MPGRYGPWLRDADYRRERREERATRTRPTRPALMCLRCGREVDNGVYPVREQDWEFSIANGEYVKAHKNCGGRVEWQEVTWAKGHQDIPPSQVSSAS